MIAVNFGSERTTIDHDHGLVLGRVRAPQQVLGCAYSSGSSRRADSQTV
jgi:hypothetical protein